MREIFDNKTVVVYTLILTTFLIIPLFGNRATMVFSETQKEKHCVIIDAGHGGVDSGAVSCSGVYESMINLKIALKLNDLMHLIGVHTVMIRDTDQSVHTSGHTIAAKKVSDIKERVRIVNSTPNALLVSIHQNNFPQSQYSGAQIFYNTVSGSRDLAENLQNSFRNNINPKNKRQPKRTSGIYLMEHINCIGVLIECGFLSNPVEEQKLRDDSYQNNISCVIATTLSQYLNT